MEWIFISICIIFLKVLLLAISSDIKSIQKEIHELKNKIK
jgi:hypothetical protein